MNIVEKRIGDSVEIIKKGFLNKEIFKGTIIDKKCIDDEDWLGFPSDKIELKVELENNNIVDINEFSKYQLK
jgi:hypothetical protein